AEACQDWRLPIELSDDAEVVATELVSNAVRHAGDDDLVLSVALGRRFLHLSVRDGSAAPPIRLIPDPYNGGGRGLIPIDALASRSASPVPRSTSPATASRTVPRRNGDADRRNGAVSVPSTLIAAAPSHRNRGPGPDDTATIGRVVTAGRYVRTVRSCSTAVRP